MNNRRGELRSPEFINNQIVTKRANTVRPYGVMRGIINKSLLPREKVSTKLTDEGQDCINAKLNKTQYKTPHPLRSAQHLLLKEKA